MQECIQKGSLNSFERLAAQLDTGSDNENGSAIAIDDGEEKSTSPAIDAMDTSAEIGMGKNPDKIPVGKKSTRKRHKIDAVPGSRGANLARNMVSKMNKRGQFKKGVKTIRAVRPVKTRKPKFKCSF